MKIDRSVLGADEISQFTIAGSGTKGHQAEGLVSERVDRRQLKLPANDN